MQLPDRTELHTLIVLQNFDMQITHCMCVSLVAADQTATVCVEAKGGLLFLGLVREGGQKGHSQTLFGEMEALHKEKKSFLSAVFHLLKYIYNSS